jgi:hypothetical protein
MTKSWKYLTAALLAGAAMTIGSTAANADDWNRKSGGQVTKKAIQGGAEANGDPLYICKAKFQGGEHPGKIRAAFGGCNVPWGGGEHMVPNYKVLSGNRSKYSWVAANSGNIPNRAVRGGQEANGENLFVCRARFQGGLHPGKIRPAFGGCNVPWGGGEHAVRSYEVLVK